MSGPGGAASHPDRARATQVVELSPAALPAAVEVLFLAFGEDPGVRWYVGVQGPRGVQRRRRWLELGVRLLEEIGQPILGIYDGDALAGAAVLIDPGRQLSVRAQARWLAGVALQCSPGMAWRILRNIVGGQRFQPSGPFLYLIQIGTTPEARGRGFGRALLDAVHARADADAACEGVYLETENPENVPLYQHFGYRVSGTTRLGPITSVSMFRPCAARGAPAAIAD